MRVQPSNTPPEKSQLSTADTANLINKSLGKHNLQKSFAKVVILAQIFGFFPAQGILGRDFRAIHFTWASARVGYTIVTILGATFVTVLQLHKIFAKGLNVIEANRLFFYCSGLASGYLYLKLAMKWPRFMKDWSCVEVMMASYGWPAGLNRRLNVLLAVFMSLALIEYILMQTNKLVLALECNNSTSEGFDYFFGKMSYSHIFSLMDYNIVMALVLQFITLQHTFIWVFNDVFVMLLSTALAYRFTQVTDRTQSMSESKVGQIVTKKHSTVLLQNKSESAWKNLREDYNRLCRLCKRVDEEISYIVLMSFASDLLFILIQLFNSLRQMKNNLERIYFYWSFGFLIVRTVCLCLFGGKVNDESTQPMLVLNSVSADVYNLEIQRFIHQIGTLEVAFTGKNFFSITRGLILSIAGAIVSYELVLMQFNDSLLETISEQIDSCPVYL
nr:PREDICTED: gustatory receptor for sugar taste 64e-like isoform X1 [Tribolium castaneum]|eukprot:XP_015836175.1 PREDICTED: gustatory receptor for sugar taste 64e-like isoform X1 [Tribolium castaneum]